MKNQECRIRPEIVDINSNNPMFYPFSVPYAKICVPDTVKNLNVKLFNLISLTNETKSINDMNRVSAYVD